VVGVEITRQALETFVAESNTDWTQFPVPKLGKAAKVFARNDNKMKLYFADIQEFSSQIEGRFDAMYDRGSIQYVEPDRLSRYAQTLKDLLNPGARLLLEVVEYDLKMLEDENLPLRVPPPYSMTTEDVKRLFEPECTVERVETHTCDRFLGKDADYHVHIIIKN
ncbi:hypothetical protein EGW08_021540, partial [Elysia chlorotica]